MNDFQLYGNVGTYIDEKNTFSFQIGEGPVNLSKGLALGGSTYTANAVPWITLDDYRVCARGPHDRQCDDIERDVKRNRLLPRLINKQIELLYGQGLATYHNRFVDGRLVREYIQAPAVSEWLDGWQRNGMEDGATDFAQAVIKNYYTFGDFFVKIRFSRGKAIGRMPVAGLESLENKFCRLATTKKDVLTDMVYYKDFRHVIVGNFRSGAAKFQIYPRFDIRDIDDYRHAAVSHHRAKSVGSFYGENETYEGSRPYIQGSNENAEYINSFLKNSLAAKVHIIIPNAWIDSKRKQITAICAENKKRQQQNQELILYNGIDVGTSFSEADLIKYLKSEMNKLSDYLTGAPNQGKAYASISFNSGGQEERWRIETVDLKYKEYITSIIEYDKRADNVLLMALGLDSSLTGITKDGIISKSGADVYYNYIIYLLGLTSADVKCSEPFNVALQLNFPDLYAQGLRLGFYREVPARQYEVSPSDRLQNIVNPTSGENI